MRRPGPFSRARNYAVKSDDDDDHSSSCAWLHTSTLRLQPKKYNIKNKIFYWYFFKKIREYFLKLETLKLCFIYFQQEPKISDKMIFFMEDG